MKHLILCFALLFCSSGLLIAQNAKITDLTDEQLARLIDDEQRVQRAYFRTQYQDDCAINATVSVNTIRLRKGHLVRLQLDGTPIGYSVVASDGEIVYQSESQPKGNTTLTLAADEDFRVAAKNACGVPIDLTTFSTRQRPAGLPLELAPDPYWEITRWQRMEDVPIHKFLDEMTELDRFAAVDLYQKLVAGDQPLVGDEDSLEEPLPSLFKSDFDSDKSTGCNCSTIRLSADYATAPIARLRSDGRISGIGNQDLNRRFGRRDAVRTDLYEYYEGAARYRELFAQTYRCSGSTGFDFFVNQDGGRGVTRGDIAEGNPAPDLNSADLTAMVSWNYVCLDRSGLEDNSCACDRTVYFSYDYESFVAASAETRTGQCIAAQRRAYASAMDLATVAFGELNSPGTYELLTLQANGQIFECEQSYQGPTPGDFLRFGGSVLNLIRSVSEDESDDGGGFDAALDEAARQLDDLFDEPWVIRGNCQAELAGRRRSMRQQNQFGRPTYQATLRPGQPIIMLLGATGSLNVGGTRHFRASASVRSSFRLGSILVGGGNPDRSGDDCCAPYTWEYILSTVGQDASGGSTEINFRDAIRRDFGLLASQSIRAWSESEWGFDYRNFSCRIDPIMIVNGEQQRGTFDNYVNLEQTANQIVFSLSAPWVPESLPLEINLFDLSGQQLRTLTLPANGLTQLNTSPFPAGLYLLVAQTPEGPVTKKILIP